MTTKFMNEVVKLDIAEFFGVARILKVKLINENGEIREFADVFADLMAAYDCADKSRKKELLKILKAANKNAR